MKTKTYESDFNGIVLPPGMDIKEVQYRQLKHTVVFFRKGRNGQITHKSCTHPDHPAELLPLKFFKKNKGGFGGKHSNCMPCDSKATMARRRAKKYDIPRERINSSGIKVKLSHNKKMVKSLSQSCNISASIVYLEADDRRVVVHMELRDDSKYNVFMTFKGSTLIVGIGVGKADLAKLLGSKGIELQVTGKKEFLMDVGVSCVLTGVLVSEAVAVHDIEEVFLRKSYSMGADEQVYLPEESICSYFSIESRVLEYLVESGSWTRDHNNNNGE